MQSKVIIGIVWLFIFGFSAISVYISLFASCDKIGFLPLQSLPARCLLK